jgi:lipopolysaccharide transport system ATP-binding protein
MSSSDAAISIRHLGKSYWLRHARGPATLAEAVARRIRHPFARTEREQFWALQDVSFDVRRGEVVGLIGRNGAGKSTLLKILSRITEMTTGEVDLRGRVGSLLEVGTGFHQDLTGRENIYMNGAVLGMTRAEIRAQFDAIVAFAGVERFLDTPVKHYSSGMYVRLAFAVAAHLRSEILIVDEVLAVGDAEFQSKCLAKMRDISGDGRTVIFVSHNMHSISLLCSKGVVLDAGHVVFAGATAVAIERYSQQFTAEDDAPKPAPARRMGSGEYRYDGAQLDKDPDASEQRRSVRFSIAHVHSRLGHFYPSAHLYDERGLEIAQLDGRLVGCWFQDRDVIHGELVIDSPWLKPGRYHLDLYLCTEGGIVDMLPRACVFWVSVMPYKFTASAHATTGGVVFADYHWNQLSDPETSATASPTESEPCRA